MHKKITFYTHNRYFYKEDIYGNESDARFRADTYQFFSEKRNAGKSSIINAITGQDLAIVSDVKGTTTDPVYKTMELLPLGPVMIIDTPGIDDGRRTWSSPCKKKLSGFK